MALVKRARSVAVRREWRAISMVFAQLVLLALIVFQLFQAIGMHVDVYLKQVVFKPSPDPSNLIVLAVAVIVFILLSLMVWKRVPALFKAEKAAPGIIRDAAKGKIALAKEEPQAPALLLVEAAFVVVVVLALKAYFDPEEELIKWSGLGLGPPYTTVINTIIALLVLGIFYKLYGLTAGYRKK